VEEGENISVLLGIALDMGETLDTRKEFIKFSSSLIQHLGYSYAALWLLEKDRYKRKYANPGQRAAGEIIAGDAGVIHLLREKKSCWVNYGDAAFGELAQGRDLARGVFGIFFLAEPEGFFKVYKEGNFFEKDLEQVNTLMGRFLNVLRNCLHHEKALGEINLCKAMEQKLNDAKAELERLLLENEIMLGEIDSLNEELDEKVLERTRELESTVAKLREIAIKDCMTGLFNRRHALKMGEEAFIDCGAKNEDFSAIMLDVDNFKKVNDTFGHVVGDKVLMILGKRLLGSVKRDDIVGRYGGEEFIVFLKCPMERAVEVAHRIKRSVSANMFVIGTGISIPITVSLGVAARKPGDTFDGLITRADNQMYRAKKSGGNELAVG